MKYLVRPIIKYPYITVILISAITFFFVYHLKNLQLNNDTYVMVPDDHPLMVAQNNIEADFGTAEIIMIGLETDNIFNKPFLEKIKQLSKKIKKLKVESDPFVDPDTGEAGTKSKRCIADVKSLSTLPYIEGDEYGMRVQKLMKNVPQNAEEMKALKERVFSWDMYVGSIVSEDATSTLIAVEYKSSLSRNEIQRMVEVVSQTVEKTDFGDGVEVFVTGKPFVNAMISTNVSRDMSRLLPAVFGVVIIFLLIALRKASYVFMIFLTIAVSVIWTIGLMALFGQSMDLVSSAIPVLLVAIGSAYSIHIINHYSDEIAQGNDPATAVYNSINIVGVSVFAASVTTMAGFMSLMTSSVLPIKKFGLFTGIGAGVAFIVAVIFVPALLMIIYGKDREKSVTTQKSSKKTSIDLFPFLLATSERLTKQSKIVMVLSVLITTIIIVFALQVYSDIDPVNNFKKSSGIKKAERLLNEKFSGMATTVIALEADEDNYFKRPDALQKLDDFKQYMEKDPSVGMVNTLAVSIKRMNYAMHESNEAFNKVPKTQELVSQYLLLYSNPEDIEGFATPDFRKIRIIMLLKDGSVRNMEELNDQYIPWLNQAFPGVKMELAGSTQLGLAMNDLVVIGQIKSLAYSVVMVFIISSIIFRSAVGGLITILPLVISVLLNFSILGFFKIPLDMGTALIASVGIGVGVDYSIHFLNGVKHGSRTIGAENACRESLNITGNAIVFNALSVAFGFLVLLFSSFIPLMKLGFFVSLTMVTACAGTLLLLPVIINNFKPRCFR